MSKFDKTLQAVSWALGIKDFCDMPVESAFLLLADKFLELHDKCRCDRLRDTITANEKRISALICEWEARNAECGQLLGELTRTKKQLENVRQEADREIREIRLELLTENAALKSRLYDMLLADAEPKRPPIKLYMKDAG